ncbi:peptidoglycan D,D-transpeptidase FtsI family protein [Wenjunlia tyrosinilytica]|uniref:Penicillin-binding protein n=1 Tax=Wenjunlia tyrosinilytica TaxID=1544741 RepID=A0A917ZNY6_9ACTN|nr:penicillin-binding protein 2 [Wenjunlia tyrosinilytica]GGO86123.1 penicillin-binding protein [Wenjunlia tyrosinilytica]
MNKPLRRVAIFCGLLIFALLVRDNWVQFVQADELKTDEHNRRVPIERYAQPRGDIVVGGKSITGSTKTDGSDFQYKRTYTNGPMYAPVTGYASQAFGSNQIENIEDGILTGDDDRLFFNRTIDVLTGKPKKGGSVVTTIDPKAQKAAFEGLGDKKGAVVALDPETGAILALASTPSYDPSSIAGNSKTDGKNWSALQKENNPDDPMLNRALRQTYPPGSTFKVVTAAAALENGLYTDIDEKTKSPLPYRLPQSTTELKNEGNIPCKNASMKVALQYSCNTVFGKISENLTNEKMKKQAERFGFNDKVFIPVRAEASVYPKDNPPQNAMAGIGQASNRATPLQMAMVAAAVANNGKLMKPYLVQELRAPNLNVIAQTTPEQMSRPVSPENAQKLQQMMVNVVERGTGTNGRIPGVEVGGKTGTAQHGVANSGKPYAWFISYAKTDKGSPVAVAVVVEDSSGTVRNDVAGGRLAAPIARDVMRAVLDK